MKSFDFSFQQHPKNCRYAIKAGILPTVFAFLMIAGKPLKKPKRKDAIFIRQSNEDLSAD